MQSWTKIHKDIHMDDPANVRQKLTMTPILSTILLEAHIVRETMKTAPQVVKVVTQRTPKPEQPKQSAPLASNSRLKPSYVLSPSQSAFLKEKGQTSYTSTAKDSGTTTHFSQELQGSVKVPGLIASVVGTRLGQRKVGCPVRIVCHSLC